VLNPKIEQWQGLRVWVVGASGGIGEALCLQLAQAGARVVLSARRAEQLERVRAAMVPAGAQPHLCIALDVTQSPSLIHACEQIQQEWGGLDVLIWLAGDYSALDSARFDLDRALQITDINYVAVLKGLHASLPMLLADLPNRSGKSKAGKAPKGVVLVSSVAGFRGLPKALAYGPSKAAMINLAEVLYLELSPRGLGVWLVNPGFVATPLTANNPFKMPALIQPDQAARDMIQGLSTGHFEIHFPKRFTGWLKLARLLPYRLYFWVIRRVTGQQA
jgi:NAD(P)-dependent dehydrogenase (short-subunit alcohol dehydrogenase family)